MDANNKDERIEAAESQPKKKGKKLPIILGAIALVVVAVGAGAWVWHEQPSFCGTVCHDTMGSYVETYENSEFLVADHAKTGLVCLDCHEADPATQLAELQVQLSGEYRLPLAKMETDDSFCLRDECHTREGIVDGLSSYATEKGEKINPHEVTFTAQGSSMTDPHSDPSGETIACFTCHTAHRKSVEIEYCFGCHHNQTFEACSDCHESNAQV